MKKTFDDLIKIVDTLLGENGCIWDKEQTHESLKTYLVEEAYEALEAIDSKNPEKIADELGDVLYQVVFHAKLSEQDREFDINDVTNAICKKLERRHPHIFSNVKVLDTKDIEKNWDEIKRAEKGEKTVFETLDSVTKSLPALMRAEKVQRKAENLGFLQKNENFSEDMKSLAEKVESGENTEENIGKLLFFAVALARKHSVVPEEALRIYTNNFINKVKKAEKEGKKTLFRE